MSTVTTKEGTEIYYKDWGPGSRLFSHMVGRSQPTIGTRICCSSSSTAIVS